MPNSDHRSVDELEGGLPHIRQSPKDRGTVELIVCRPQSGEREMLAQGTLDSAKGLVGDNWHSRGSSKTADGSANLETQVTLMNSRCIALVLSAAIPVLVYFPAAAQQKTVKQCNDEWAANKGVRRGPA